MKTFKKFLESYEPVNEAEYNKEWWDSKSDSYKKRYIERHPNSIYAQKSGQMSKPEQSTKTDAQITAPVKKAAASKPVEYKDIPDFLQNDNISEKQIRELGDQVVNTYEGRREYKDWEDAATALMKSEKTPAYIVRKMQEISPYIALLSPKADREFLDKMINNLNPISYNSKWNILIKNKNLSPRQKKTMKKRLEQALEDLKNGEHRIYGWEDIADHIPHQIKALDDDQYDVTADIYKPFLVINKDTGNSWEFDSYEDAQKKKKELVKDNFGDDIRIMKQSSSGNFIKWM